MVIHVASEQDNKARKGRRCDNSTVQVYLLTPMDRKIDHIARPTEFNTRQRASVDSKLLCRPRNVDYYHIFNDNA